MDKTKITIGALVIAVIVLGVIGYTVRKPVVNVNVEPAEVQVGAIPGTEISGETWTVNGVTHWSYSQPVKNSSSTVCSIRSPSATSTLIGAGINLTTGTTTALVWTIGIGTNDSNATTTSLGYVHSWAGKGVMRASTTPDSLGSAMVDNALVFGPSSGIASSTYINFKYGPTKCPNTAANCNGLAGKCWAEFISVN